MTMASDTALSKHCDVAVVGGGPSGIAAATRLKQLGVGNVVVIEREADTGGIPRHCGHSPFGLREFRRLMTGKQYAARLCYEAQSAGVHICTGTNVVNLSSGLEPELTVTGNDGVKTISARRVILATGVREQSRAARMIGGKRLPGIVSTGALQSLVYLKGLVPFSRPVILGTELVSFSSLLTCRHAGANPVAMVEPNDRVTAWWYARGLPALLGVPIHLGTKIQSIQGKERMEGVVLQTSTGTMKKIDCDGLVVSGCFLPESTLARSLNLAIDEGTLGPSVDQFGRCSSPHIFATGNLLRPVETAGWCWKEGIQTAEHVYLDLAGKLPDPVTAVPVVLDTSALKYVMAQRICPDESGKPHFLQLRATRRVRGHLLAEADGEVIWSGMLDTRPERRIRIPVEPLRLAASKARSLKIRLEEYA